MTTEDANLSNTDFNRLRALIYEEAGIDLGREKKTMLEVRLRRRLRHLQISSFAEYCDYIFAPGRQEHELVLLIDAVTTNKTDFFREAGHFEFLVRRALPELAASGGTRRRSLIWSAGCSTGEEPYTLAMVLSEYAESCPGFQFSVLASDICTEVLEKARRGVFTAEHANAVPPDLRRKYFLRSREPGSELVRAAPELRALVEFRRVNLMDSDYRLPQAPEIIFCRNVIIYFNRQTQEQLLQRLVRDLMPGGYFFAGHSESLQSMDLPLVPAAPSVYRKAR